jgi:hypothetical protein
MCFLWEVEIVFLYTLGNSNRSLLLIEHLTTAFTSVVKDMQIAGITNVQACVVMRHRTTAARHRNILYSSTTLHHPQSLLEAFVRDP